MQAGQILQGGDRRSRRQIITGVDMNDAQPTGEGCLDGLLLQDGLQLRGTRPALAEGGAGLVELRLGNALALQQIALAIEIQLRQFHLGLGGGQTGALHFIMHAQQGLPGIDHLSGYGGQLINGAGDLGGELHSLACRQRADGWQPALPLDLLRFTGADLNRWFGSGKNGNLLPDRPEFPRPESGDNDDEDEYQQNESTQHDCNPDAVPAAASGCRQLLKLCAKITGSRDVNIEQKCSDS